MNEMVLDSNTRWYRNGPSIIIYVILPILWLLIVSALLSNSSLGLRHGEGLLIIVLSGLVVVVPAAVLLILLMRSGIGVNSDGVTVRGVQGRSRHVPWHEVVRFDVDTRSLVNQYGTGTVNYVTVVCRDGSSLRTMGCRFSMLDRRGSFWSARKGFSTPLGPDAGPMYQVVDALESARRHAQHVTEPGVS